MAKISSSANNSPWKQMTFDDYSRGRNMYNALRGRRKTAPAKKSGISGSKGG